MKLSESCSFGALRESFVRGQLILGVKDDRVRENFLGKRDLNVDKAIATIKKSQVTQRASEREISEESSANEDINAVRQKRKPKRGKRPDCKRPSKLKECLFFGGTHVLERKLCPASGQKCERCGKEGHFAVKCRNKSKDAKVHMVEQEVFYIHSIRGKDQALVSLTLNDSASLTFQIDFGSSANILSLQDYIRATEITLFMHDHSKEKALGSCAWC